MAAACVAEWRRRLYDPPPTDDPHYITFDPFDPVTHESARKTMMESGAPVAVNGRGGGGGGGEVGSGGDGNGESANRGKSSDKVCFEKNARERAICVASSPFFFILSAEYEKNI